MSHESLEKHRKLESRKKWLETFLPLLRNVRETGLTGVFKLFWKKRSFETAPDDHNRTNSYRVKNVKTYARFGITKKKFTKKNFKENETIWTRQACLFPLFILRFSEGGLNDCNATGSLCYLKVLWITSEVLKTSHETLCASYKTEQNALQMLISLRKLGEAQDGHRPTLVFNSFEKTSLTKHFEQQLIQITSRLEYERCSGSMKVLVTVKTFHPFISRN